MFKISPILFISFCICLLHCRAVPIEAIQLKSLQNVLTKVGCFEDENCDLQAFSITDDCPTNNHTHAPGIGALNCDKNGNVIHLDLQSTSLEGIISSEIGMLTALTRLRIAGNSKVSGNLPKEIEKCTKLEQLLLYRNKLGGTLPNLSVFTELKTVLLQRNHFEGAIPELPDRLTSASFYENELEGTLPKIPSYLRFLKVNNNRLYSQLPTQAANLSVCWLYSGSDQEKTNCFWDCDLPCDCDPPPSCAPPSLTSTYTTDAGVHMTSGSTLSDTHSTLLPLDSRVRDEGAFRTDILVACAVGGLCLAYLLAAIIYLVVRRRKAAHPLQTAPLPGSEVMYSARASARDSASPSSGSGTPREEHEETIGVRRSHQYDRMPEPPGHRQSVISNVIDSQRSPKPSAPLQSQRNEYGRVTVAPAHYQQFNQPQNEYEGVGDPIDAAAHAGGEYAVLQVKKPNNYEQIDAPLDGTMRVDNWRHASHDSSSSPPPRHGQQSSSESPSPGNAAWRHSSSGSMSERLRASLDGAVDVFRSSIDVVRRNPSEAQYARLDDATAFGGKLHDDDDDNNDNMNQRGNTNSGSS